MTLLGSFAEKLLNLREKVLRCGVLSLRSLFVSLHERSVRLSCFTFACFSPKLTAFRTAFALSSLLQRHADSTAPRADQKRFCDSKSHAEFFRKQQQKVSIRNVFLALLDLSLKCQFSWNSENWRMSCFALTWNSASASKYKADKCRKGS